MFLRSLYVYIFLFNFLFSVVCRFKFAPLLFFCSTIVMQLCSIDQLNENNIKHNDRLTVQQ